MHTDGAWKIMHTLFACCLPTLLLAGCFDGPCFQGAPHNAL